MIRSLTFLLLVVAACPPNTGDTTGDATDTTTDATTGSAPPTGDGPTTGGPTSDGTGTGTGTGTETGEPTPTTGEPTTGDDTGDTTADAGCQAYCNNDAMCSAEPDPEHDCLEGCQSTIPLFEYIGPACVTAFETTNQCVGALSCEDFVKVGESNDYPCLSEEQAVASTCVIPECTQQCMKEDMCGLLEPEDKNVCGLYCSTEIAGLSVELGDDCGDAARLYTACLGGLECAELTAGTGCDAELAAYMGACG